MEFFMRNIYCIIVVCFLTACVSVSTERPVLERVNFPNSEYVNLVSNGTGTVKGQAFLKTRGGDVKTAAGNEVILNSVTSYSTQWFEKSYKGGNVLAEPDQRYLDSIISTIADADGRFEFEDVPPGKYYLVSSVTWETPTGYNGGLRVQGGYIAEIISVKNDIVVNIILTR
jgi:hypothetical protein